MPDATAHAAVPPQEEVPTWASVLQVVLVADPHGPRRRLAAFARRIGYRLKKNRGKP